MNRKRLRFGAKLIPILAISLGISATSLTSCTSKTTRYSDEQLKRQAEQTTENMKEHSKEVLQDARAATANAEQKVNDITAGVQEGLKNGHPASASRININTASENELASLPDISRAKARQIIARRPYRASHQLVDRGLLTESQYTAVSPDVTAR